LLLSDKSAIYQLYQGISLEIVTIKWKAQLTKRFIKNGEGKQAK
jgi:hypothetical protein